MENVNEFWHGSMWMGMEVGNGKMGKCAMLDWPGDY